jgi:hypothetical protein
MSRLKPMRKCTASADYAIKRASYPAARAQAQASADLHGLDMGIEWLGEGNMGHWHVFMLPRPENRFGHELRCEVVVSCRSKEPKCEPS